MFADFLQKLHPCYEEDKQDWQENLIEWQELLGGRAPSLFWYPSSALDYNPFLFFKDRMTQKLFQKTPPDFLFFSDFGGFERTLQNYYDRILEEDIFLYRGDQFLQNLLWRPFDEHIGEDGKSRIQTEIEIDELIPLRYFSKEEYAILKEKHADCMTLRTCGQEPLSESVHFYYCRILVHDDQEESIFHLFFAPMDNRVLMTDVFRPQNLKFDYLCAVCDGCSRGGNYECINEHWESFRSILTDTAVWITDHMDSIQSLAPVAYREFCKVFPEQRNLRFWKTPMGHVRGYLTGADPSRVPARSMSL